MIIEFKVFARYNNGVIKGTTFKRGPRETWTIFKDGTIINRAPIKEELSNVYDVALIAKEPVPGQPNEQRFFGGFKYFDEKTEEGLKPIEKERNLLIRKWHSFLKYHDHIVTRDEKGNDYNENNIHSGFEMVDITGNTYKTEEQNKKKIEAQKLLLNLFENSNGAFIDFCYAYSMPDVANLDPSTLFNMCIVKISNNVDYFLSVFNNKNRDILTLIEKALTINIGDSVEPRKALDVKETGAIYLDGEIIAQTRNELEEVLLMDVSKRRIVENLVGYTVTSGVVSKKNTESYTGGFLSEDEKIASEASKNGKKQDALQEDFKKALRPILNFTKEVDKREEKINVLLAESRFASIEIWAKTYVSEQVEKKNSKEKAPLVMKSIEV